MKQYSVIGKRVPPVDGIVKVTGEAQYFNDIMLPRMLYGKILRSPLPHAKILNIDTSKAERVVGVKAVITGKDTLGIPSGHWGGHPPEFAKRLFDKCALAMDKVRFIGDEVAAVAAVDENVAEEALDLIKVEYEELPAVFDPEEAIKKTAPKIHDHVENNISATRSVDLGDVESGFKESDYIREDRFTTQFVAHACIEPAGCLATYDSTGRVTIWTPTQRTYAVQFLLALMLGIKDSDVRVIRTYFGGGFGGKTAAYSYHLAAALLSKKTGRPVKIELTRGEEFAFGNRRHPMTIRLKTGVKKDGTLMAREVTNILDGGAYNFEGPVVNYKTCYYPVRTYRVGGKVPNYKYRGYRAYTNKTPCGAMRGFGAPQQYYAVECQMDMIAEELGIDPIELRLKNAVQVGDGWLGAKYLSCGLSDCIQQVVQRSGWYEKRGKLPKGRGIGIGCSCHPSGPLQQGFDPRHSYCEVWVKLVDDGSVNVFSQAVDVGQGSDTVLSMIVAEELGISAEDVRMAASDSLLAPMDMGSVGDRVTFMVGNAAKDAAADAKRQLFEGVAKTLKLGGKELVAEARRVHVKGDPDNGVSFREAVRAAQAARRGESIMGKGVYAPTPEETGDLATPASSFQAQVAEVEVDMETGQVKVLRFTAAHDGGTAVNPMASEGQIEGGVHMGLGYALSEEVLVDKGTTLNPSFRDYKVFSAMDMPETEAILVKTEEPKGPFGAKGGIGEGSVNPVAPAIVNAIHDATGVWIKDLPVTPEKIFRALRQKDKGA